MPVYEYYCPGCQAAVEVRRPAAEATPVSCPHCGRAELVRRFSRVALVTSETDRTRDLSWIDRDLARRVKKTGSAA